MTLVAIVIGVAIGIVLGAFATQVGFWLADEREEDIF